ncbi:hypothetical protein VDGL01_09072 [Verticillium dahliae]
MQTLIRTTDPRTEITAREIHRGALHARNRARGSIQWIGRRFVVVDALKREMISNVSSGGGARNKKTYSPPTVAVVTRPSSEKIRALRRGPVRLDPERPVADHPGRAGVVVDIDVLRLAGAALARENVDDKGRGCAGEGHEAELLGELHAEVGKVLVPCCEPESNVLEKVEGGESTGKVYLYKTQPGPFQSHR